MIRIPAAARPLAPFALLALAAFAPPADAGQVASAWYHGSWDCLIDGRSARMVWEVVDAPNTRCSGGVCSTTSGVAVRGWFSDSGSRWVRLDSPRGTGQDLRFVYTGDNTNWYLRADASRRRAVGNTIWQNNAYPLSCAKR